MERIKESTLQNPPLLLSGRMVGNTTRLVDHAIQLLFDGKIVVVHDDWDSGKHKRANEHLFTSILKRLNFEHSHIVDKLVVDKKKMEIYLK
jgi:hypothetical protein